MDFFYKNEENELKPNDLEYEIVDDEQKDDEFNSNIVELINYIIQLKYKPYYDASEFNYIYQKSTDILTNFVFLNNINQKYLEIFMKLILHTRNPKGFSRTFASFVMLDVLDSFNETDSHIIFEKMLLDVGCWKDLKRFYDYHCEYKDQQTMPKLVIHGIKYMSLQLLNDINNFTNEKYNEISYAAKWAPREKSKYNHLFCLLAKHYFSEYFNDEVDNEYKKALNKAKMNLRKILSTLNRQLDTVQIKQCGKKWSKIIPESQTIRNLKIYKNAFLNKSSIETSDRIICSYNFEEYYNSKEKSSSENELSKINLNNLISSQLFLDSYKIDEIV